MYLPAKIFQFCNSLKKRRLNKRRKLNQVDIIVSVFGGGSSIYIACLSKLNTSTYKFYKLKIAYSFRPVAQQNSDLDSFYTSMLEIVL